MAPVGLLGVRKPALQGCSVSTDNAFLNQCSVVVSRWHKLLLVMEVLKELGEVKTFTLLKLTASRNEHSLNRLPISAVQVKRLADTHEILPRYREFDRQSLTGFKDSIVELSQFWLQSSVRRMALDFFVLHSYKLV